MNPGARGKARRRFDPGGICLAIWNVGDGREFFRRKEFVRDDPLVFRPKDAVDRRTMRK